MKKKIKILVIVGLLLIVCSYFGYKVFNLVRYDFHGKSNVINNLEIIDSITLKYYQELDDNQEYLEFKNIKVRNDFKDFEFLEDVSTKNDLKYVLYDENKNHEAAIMIGVDSNYVEMLKSDINIFSDDDVDLSSEDLNGIAYFLKEKGINSDIQLFKYLIEHKDDRNNIFTSTKEMKNNYILYYIMNTILPSNEGITLIDGTYAGYIFNLGNGVKEVSILYYDKRYGFTFMGEDYFTDEYIYDFLNTLVIESSIDESGHVVFPSENENDTFTRTYSIIGKVENNSLEYDSFEIKQFQDEETVVVEIKKDLAVVIEKGKNYEFTFKKNKGDNIADNIESIFDNAELISIVETEKIGLDQTQEPIK